MMAAGQRCTAEDVYISKRSLERVNYIESVTEGEQDLETLRSFTDGDYRLVFGTSFGFIDNVIRVASLFPDMVFMHCSGYKTATNVRTYFGRNNESIYLTGLIAGSMTKSNIIGYVATFNIPEVIRGINAFALGVEKVNRARCTGACNMD